MVALIAVAAAAAGALAAFVLQPTRSPTPLVLNQVTFQRGWVGSGRFAPDGQTVYYGAAWNGPEFSLYVARPGSPGSRPASSCCGHWTRW